MSRTLTVTFNIIIENTLDEFVKDYFGYSDIEEVTYDDIREYIENNITPATTNTEAFDVEGGDTGGWFVQRWQ